MGHAGLSFWDQVIMVTMLVIVGYLITQNLKRNPNALSSENLNKSFRFMGILAIGLIGFVSFLIFLLPPGPAPSPDMKISAEALQESSAPSRPMRSL